MKRRDFLKTSSLGFPLLINGLKVSANSNVPFFNFVNNTDKVLVLIQLNGGNDGLNTLIPLDQYDKLINVRQNVIIPENQILNISDNNGFHPSFNGMKNLFDEGKLNIIQDVGYPNQNRSHFRSLDIWDTGASAANEFLKTGWIGRYFDSVAPGYPEGFPSGDYPDPFAITIGFTVHETCQGISSNFSTTVPDPDNISTITEAEAGEIDLETCYGRELKFVKESILQTNAYTDSISTAANLGSNLSTYSNESLSQQLKTVARLISGGLKTSVYTVYLGGFDNHADQVVGSDTTQGTHAQLLNVLSDAITSFQEDLELHGLEERVIGMTYSEFGRQIKSNNSLGTDHGTAAPLFVFGSCVNPTIIGENYNIPDEVPNQAGVPMQYDFRSVYGSILMDWFGVEETQVQNLLFDDFQHIPILQDCTTTDTDDPFVEENFESKSFPNPFNNWTTISFKTKGGRVKISIFDTLGHEIKVVSSQQFSSGEHNIKVDLSDLPQGIYHYRIVSKHGQQTKSIQKY